MSILSSGGLRNCFKSKEFGLSSLSMEGVTRILKQRSKTFTAFFLNTGSSSSASALRDWSLSRDGWIALKIQPIQTTLRFFLGLFRKAGWRIFPSRLERLMFPTWQSYQHYPAASFAKASLGTVKNNMYAMCEFSAPLFLALYVRNRGRRKFAHRVYYCFLTSLRPIISTLRNFFWLIFGEKFSSYQNSTFNIRVFSWNNQD